MRYASAAEKRSIHQFNQSKINNKKGSRTRRALGKYVATFLLVVRNVAAIAERHKRVVNIANVTRC